MDPNPKELPLLEEPNIELLPVSAREVSGSLPVLAAKLNELPDDDPNILPVSEGWTEEVSDDPNVDLLPVCSNG